MFRRNIYAWIYLLFCFGENLQLHVTTPSHPTGIIQGDRGLQGTYWAEDGKQRLQYNHSLPLIAITNTPAHRVHMNVIEAQLKSLLPLSADSFRPIMRMKMLAPPGRLPEVKDVIIRFYVNSTKPAASYPIGKAKELLDNHNFNLHKPTVLYAHGYIELTTDESVTTVVNAYIDSGGYNVLVLDWANLGFGFYVTDVLYTKAIGDATCKVLVSLLNSGLELEGLHLVGHSMGAHIQGYAARCLAAQNYTLPRLTGLDPAGPGFHPPLLSEPLGPQDADFVDIIHTDGGYYGTSSSTGHADYWPNGGYRVQPGCFPAPIPLTIEDFCSHWVSWRLWAESVTNGELLARRCGSYDLFLRGRCSEEPLVDMGNRASPDLKGNFYLKTAAEAPYALGVRGAE